MTLLGVGVVATAVMVWMPVMGCRSGPDAPAPAREPADYGTLVRLVEEFRRFQQPPLIDGIPDYSPEAMAGQIARLPEFRNRLDALDTSGWPVEQLVDYEICRAEMNGMEFDHRVLRPWARDPSFYAAVTSSEPDVPAREGPEIPSVLNLWQYDFPLEGEPLNRFRDQLAAIPELLRRAKENLTENTKQLHFFAIRQKAREIRILESLEERLADSHPELVARAAAAREAVAGFRDWLETRYQAMPESADGIGIQEFDWYMKHVHLVPFSWKEQEDICRRELERAWAALRLEELRNRELPPLEPAGSLEELQGRLERAVDEFMGFLRDTPIFTVPEYMHLDREIRFYQPPERRDFFTQVDYRDFLPLRCHMVHWLEKQREARNHHAVRGVPLLYVIWDSRAEGFATAFEETMLQAGLMDRRPRARELVYILLAFRAARAMGDLKLHSREWTIQQAIDFAAAATPRGWVLPEGNTILGDLGIYLRQPGYGTSYVYGKIQFERLLADRARELGDRFELKAFMDDYFARGIIPASLIRWEMTGRPDVMEELWR
jgi:hypothetical protein